MKIYKYIFLLGILSGMASSCKISDDGGPVRNVYIFEQPVTLSPVKTTYLTGDVIFFETRIDDKTLTDLLSGENILIGNAKFPIVIEALELAPGNPVGTEKYALIEGDGIFDPDENFISNGYVAASFGCPEESYIFRMGIQFVVAGNYLVHLNRQNLYQSIAFSESSDCSQTETIPYPDGVDVGSVYYPFDLDNTNRDGFDQFLIDNDIPDSEAVFKTRESLDNKEAFFVKVN